MLKYRGTYRVVHEVDRRTLKPTDNVDDTYIYCTKRGQIWRYSQNILVYEREGCNVKQLKNKLVGAGIEIIDEFGDNSSIKIFFNEKDIHKVAKIVQARTLGANISPNSKKNLKLLGLV